MKSLTNNLLMLICCSLLFTVFITAVAIYGDKHSTTQNNLGLQAKDLTADIMPPPIYLIELRLVVSQLVEGSITLEQERLILFASRVSGMTGSITGKVFFQMTCWSTLTANSIRPAKND